MADRLALTETAEQVSAALDRLVPEGPLGLAVSGGGDSVALMHIACDWAARRGRALFIATVDHGLRPEARGEAQEVARMVAALGLGHTILGCPDLSPEAPGNLPAAARDARYAALTAWARAKGLAAVLLGHTQDDQAETVLMRLARGSGVEGLSAMAEATRRGGMLWLRPMLEVTRAALRDELTARGARWIEDPTNEDLAHDRVKARQALATLAPLGITTEGLAATAARLARQRRVLEADLSRLAAQAARAVEGSLLLDPARLWPAEEDTRLRLLAWALRTVSGAPYRPRFRALERLAGAIAAAPEGRATLSGCSVRWQGGAAGEISICREEAAATMLDLAPGRPCWDGRWRLICPADLGPGLRVGPLNHADQVVISAALQKISVETHAVWVGLPADLRAVLPAIRDAEGRILAVGRAEAAPFTVISPDLGIRYEDLVALELHQLVSQS